MVGTSGIAVWAEEIKADLKQRLPGQRKTQRDKRPVRLSGTGKQRKAVQNSHAELGFLSGLSPPLRTMSGREKSYRPRKLRCRQISGALVHFDDLKVR